MVEAATALRRPQDGPGPESSAHTPAPGSPVLTRLHGRVPGVHRLQDLVHVLLQPAHGGRLLPEEVGPPEVYRLTSWLRAGGWLWAVGPVRPPRAQAPRARRCLWASRACWRPGGERGCPEGAADKGKGPRGRAHRHLLLCSVLTKNKFLDQNLNTRRTQTPVRTDTGEPAPVS